MLVVKKYVAYLVFDDDNPQNYTASFEVGDSPMPAIFEEQFNYINAREARKAAINKVKSLESGGKK
jgi:hypothetical protein